MTPRERILAALDHRESDRIPIDMGSSIVTSVTKAAYVPLRKYLGLPHEEVVVYDEVQQLPYIGEDVLTRFGVDTRMVQLPPTHVQGVEIVDDGEYWAMWDRWGSKMRMPKDKPLYYDWVDFPIKEMTLEALKDYRWPEPDPPELIAGLRERAEHLRTSTDYALVGSGVIGGGIFEQPCRTVGMERFMMGLLQEPSSKQQAPISAPVNGELVLSGETLAPMGAPGGTALTPASCAMTGVGLRVCTAFENALVVVRSQKLHLLPIRSFRIAASIRRPRKHCGGVRSDQRPIHQRTTTDCRTHTPFPVHRPRNAIEPHRCDHRRIWLASSRGYNRRGLVGWFALRIVGFAYQHASTTPIFAVYPSIQTTV